MARLATVNADGQPDVVPVAFEVDKSHIWVGGVGAQVLSTRKFRNIGAGRTKVTLEVDSLVSMEPFNARAFRLYGDAEPPIERVGMVGPACTAGSHRGCRGAGIWQVSRSASSGTRRNAPSILRDLR